MTVTFDTNVLVYAANADSGPRHHRAIELLDRAARVDCVQPLQTYGEFFHVVTRKGGLAPAMARLAIEKWLRLFRVSAADEGVLRTAIMATDVHGIAFWDAMLWATAEASGARFLVSEDLQDGRRLGLVTFVNPFRTLNDGLINAILPPAMA
jgi:predicted nucleic acid-binding protein